MEVDRACVITYVAWQMGVPREQVTDDTVVGDCMPLVTMGLGFQTRKPLVGSAEMKTVRDILKGMGLKT